MADFYGFHPPAAAGGGGGAGTVTSVGLSDGSDTPIYGISGSPVTNSGTLTFTLADQTANRVFAGPTTGSPDQPSFRALGYSDLPTIANNTVLGNKSGGAAVPSAQTLGTVTEATSAVLTLTGWSNSVVGTPTIQVLQSSGAQSGYLSSTDWNTFNNKQSALSFGNLTGNVAANISVTGGTGAVIGSGASIAQLVANGSQNGYLSSTDWTTFNNKGSGSVTSVALSVPATSIFGVTGSPVTTTGTLGLTTTGTSGGIPYFSSTSQLASSAALTVNQLIVGGGAGATPATLSAGTLGQVLRMNSTPIPEWGPVNVASSAAVTGTLATGNGGTGKNTNYTALGVVYADTTTSLSNIATGSSGNVLTSNGASAPSMQDLRGNATVFKAPTVQKFTSGSGTYTTATSPSPLYIEVEMCGGGGGGGGSGTAGGSAAGDGGTTTFGTTLLSCNGGVKGAYVGAGGAGGSASLGSGPIGTVLTGGSGSGGGGSATANCSYGGGHGGVNPFGGGGGGGSPSAAGLQGVANTGGGGGGGGAPSAGNCGSGGGAGGYVKAIIASPSATYSYAVGGSGTAGGAGTGGAAGGAGGTGYIIVREFYQ